MSLDGKRIIIAIAEGYHEHEFWYPYYRFREEGAEVVAAGPKTGTVFGEGRNGRDGLPAVVTRTIEQELADARWDALYLPGGIWSPLALRAHPPMLGLVCLAMSQETPVAAICHATWVLASAGVLSGKRVSCPSDMATDATNAGATVAAEHCVVDGNLITAEYFAYLPEHLRAVIGVLTASPKAGPRPR